MGGCLNLATLSVFVIVYYIQITKSKSINPAEITNTTIENTIELPTTSESNSTQRSFKIKPMVINGQSISYEEFLSRNPRRVEITSDNYPGIFPGPGNQAMFLEADSGTGVDIIIHYMDLNPVSDFLYIRGSTDLNSNENGVMYTGQPNELPIRIRILSTNSFTLRFESTAANTKYTGYVITYDSYGEIPVVTEPPVTEFPINDLALEFKTVHLNISADQQNNVTWNILRTSFSDMANKYIKANNISANESLPEYVVFQSIKKCPSSWRDAENCMSVVFALPVPIVPIDEDDKDNQYKINRTNFEYELTANKLDSMWDQYAKDILLEKNIWIFEKQNSLVLLMWIGISLAIITVFLLVLYSIWRMDQLQAYRRFRNNRSDSIVEDNIAKPSIMEEQSHYYLEPSLFFDEDTNENHDHMYSTNGPTSGKKLFVIADEDSYPTRRQSYSTLQKPNNRVQNANGLPKSALKNTQFVAPQPPQHKDNSRNESEVEGHIKIIPPTSFPDRPHIYLPDDQGFEESNT